MGTDDDTTDPKLRLLGPLQLELGGAPLGVPPIGDRLLARLALVDGWEHRQVTAERLWPDADAERRAGSLRTALWRLGGLPGVPVVELSGQLLRLSPRVDTDLGHARTLCRAVLDGQVPTAPILLLAELTSDVLPDWDADWVALERERFRQLRLHALEALSATLSARGAHASAVEAALSAVAAEPLRESARRAVIAAYLAEGNVADANRQYHRYRRRLADELGLEPSPEMSGLLFPRSEVVTAR